MSRGNRKPYERPSSPGRADRGAWVHDKAPGVNANSAAAQPSARLAVSNLHYELQEKDLAKIFGVIGELAREPVIRYDRSGRSTGTAYITYNSASEAARAKEQLDGLTAKGEQMNIAYDTRPPPGGRRTGKLIDRIGDDFENNGPGPVRTRGGGRGGRARGRGGPREEREGRGGAGGGGGSRRASAREVPTTKSLADLDKELEAFMGEGTKESSTNAATGQADPTPAGGATEDVAMT